MTKQLLEDVIPIKLSLNESDGKIRISGPFGLCGTPTANGRLYSRPIIESNIKKLQEAMSNRRLFGELDHPSDGKTSLKRVSHIITDLRIEDDGTVSGTMEPLPTPMGNVLKALAEAGCELGVSSRGMGSVVSRDGVDEVQDDFVLKTYDVVADPASKNAYPKVVKEAIQEAVEVYASEQVTLDSLQADDRARLFAEAQEVVRETAALTEGSEAADDVHHDGDLDEAAVKMDKFSDDAKTYAYLTLASAAALDSGDTALAELLTKKKQKMSGARAEGLRLAKLLRKKALGMKEEDFDGLDFGLSEEDLLGEAKQQASVVQAAIKSLKLTPANMGFAPNGAGFVTFDGGSNSIQSQKDAEKLVAFLKKKNVQAVASKLAGTRGKYKVNVSAPMKEDESGLAEEVERLKAALSGSLVEQLEDLREDIRNEERAKLLADPEVAGAKAMVEAIAGIVRPLMVPERTREVMTDLRNQNVALQDALKDKSFQLSTAHLDMANLQTETDKRLLGARLSEMIAGHPKADFIRTVIGPVERFESEQELVDRVESLFQEIGHPSEVLTAPQEDLQSQIEDLEAQIEREREAKASMERRLVRAVEIGEQLQSAVQQAEQAVNEADERADRAEAQAYAARKAVGRPDAARFMSLAESASTTEEVDRIANANPVSQRVIEDEQAQRIRSAHQRGRARSLEEEVTPRHGAGSSDNFFMNHSVDEIARLAGVAPSR